MEISCDWRKERGTRGWGRVAWEGALQSDERGRPGDMARVKCVTAMVTNYFPYRMAGVGAGARLKTRTLVNEG